MNLSNKVNINLLLEILILKLINNNTNREGSWGLSVYYI